MHGVGLNVDRTREMVRCIAIYFPSKIKRALFPLSEERLQARAVCKCFLLASPK
jgi:hypothetical protein